MRRSIAFAALVFVAIPMPAFQESEAAKPARLTPKEKAAELLQAVTDMAPGAQPEVAATALTRVAENMNALDRKKALECLGQAFAAASGIPPADDARREQVQVLVVASAAQVSLPEAVAMLKQVQAPPGEYDPRQDALDTLVERMLGEKNFGDAIELVNAVGATGQYPYSAAGKIFEKLPKDDPRRDAVFGMALATYRLRPAEAFSKFLSEHWKDLQRAAAEAAVSAVVSHILSYPGDEALVESVSAANGALTLHTRQEVELFDILHLLREFDPKRADQILETHPELKAAIARFPDGRDSMGFIMNWTRGSDAGSAPANAAGQAQAASVLDQLMKLGENDKGEETPEAKRATWLKAFYLVKTISDADSRAQFYAMALDDDVKDDPTLMKLVVSEILATAKDVKDPVARAELWSNLGAAAHAKHDDKLATEAFDKALDSAGEIYKRDSNPDEPNMGLRDEWPSTNAYRKVTIGVTKAFGVDAGWILTRISDPDIAVYARIEMAQALLERPHENWRLSTEYTKK